MSCGKTYFFLGEHTASEQANSIADYLPDDETFEAKCISGTNTRTMLEVFADQLKKLEELINIFTNETSPECASQLIEEWERMVGIPDDCFNNTDTLEIRRRNVLIKLALMNVQTVEDFQELANSFGIIAVVTPGVDAGVTPLSVARFTIVITYVLVDVATFPLTFPISFGTDIVGLLTCVFEKVKPANCQVLFDQVPLNLETFMTLSLGAKDYWSLDEI